MKPVVAFAFVALTIIAYAQSPSQTLQSFQSDRTLRFTENKGQLAGPDGKPANEVKFYVRDGAVRVFIQPGRVMYQWTKIDNTEALRNNKFSLGNENQPLEPLKGSTYRMDMEFVGANTSVVAEAKGKSHDYENYYHAHCPDGVLGVRSYEEILFKEVYSGIDLRWYVKSGKLEYDFIVKPGADPSLIKIRLHDAQQVKLDENGGLTLVTALGTLHKQAPYSFMLTTRKIVNSKFELSSCNELTFALETYDKSQTLVIDPALEWATYYGGMGTEFGRSVATDGNGNVYLTGKTEGSISGIAFSGHQNTYGGAQNAFLVKFNSIGIRQWATYYHTNTWFDESGHSVAIDTNSNVYMAGINTLVKFNSAGTLQWAYGGLTDAYGLSVISDGSNLYLAGSTPNSTLGIISNGHQNTIGGSTDAFLAKFNSAGVLQWGTYYGGIGEDVGRSVAVDATGNVYLAGYTYSTTDIAIGGHQNTYGGGSHDAFLVKFNSAGIRQWGSYYGGTGGDIGNSVAIDGTGSIYLAGETKSINNISMGIAHQNSLGGGEDAFLVKFNSAGVRQWGTYYGGSQTDYATSVATDVSGNIYLAGETKSATNIAMGIVHQSSLGGGEDAFLVKFNSAGVRQWGTYYGGSQTDYATSVAIYTSNYAYLGGTTSSLSNIASGGHQNNNGGDGDAFLVKFDGICFPLITHNIDTTICSVQFTIGGTTYTQSGNYQITIPKQNGCDSTINLNLTILPSSLNVSLSVTNTSPGATDGSITIVASGGNAPYQFSLDGITFTANNVFSNLPSGSYTAYVKDNSGCVASSGFTISEQPCASFQLTLSITSATAGMNNGAIKVIATGATQPVQYSLDSLNFSASNTFNGLAPGTYTIYAVDASGCTASSTFEITITSGINTSSNNCTFEIYPNPARNVLNIVHCAQTGKFVIELFDMVGKMKLPEIQTSTNETAQFILPENLPQGTYMLSIKTDEGIAVKKILKM